jgi:16S rRNA processing protein RimM
MRKEDCFYLGKIAKKFSFKGEVLAYLDTNLSYTKNWISVCWMQQTLGSIFYWKQSSHKNDFLRIRFEDMNTEEDADAVIGNDLYLP